MKKRSSTTMAKFTPLHPYYPQDILLPQYVPNDWSLPGLLLGFSCGVILILSTALLLAQRVNPKLSFSDRSLVLWFVLTGSIHCFFEGYYVLNHASIAGDSHFLAQLWKEYTLSDSRYLILDPLVLCMESWTVIIWGPLSLLTALLITTDSPYRHPIQALVSTGQFYGDLLYYSTSLYEDFALGRQYYRPEPYYFWVYFVVMNTFWLIIPGYCLYGSITTTAEVFRRSKREEHQKAL
ncbi:Emopamil binding protein-domain-containing protein [Xylogone sp. PMI_703]|nr:Emopamil binding protein-domain-containing protein [Xylogone sp. PMI_703]